MADEKKPVNNRPSVRAVRATKKEQYANIELLLRNWHILKYNIENTLDNQDKLAWREIELLMDNPFMDYSMRVESLTRQRQYTQIIYEHVNCALISWLNPRKRIGRNARLRRIHSHHHSPVR